MTDRVAQRDLPPKNRVWLCLDPGITTGMALLDDSGELRASTVWGTGEIRQSLDTLVRALHLSNYDIEVVIEKMPPGSYGKLAVKLEAVRRDIQEVVTETYELPVTYIAPGEWKPSRIAKTTKVKGWRHDGTPMMTHQKDALRMGRYIIDKRKRTMEKMPKRDPNPVVTWACGCESDNNQLLMTGLNCTDPSHSR